MPGIPAETYVIGSKDQVPSCYQHIPEPLPKEITLQDVIKSIPPEYFQKNMLKAWLNVVKTVTFSAFSIYLLTITPWYLLPFAWFFAGTAVTGLFVIGHDCGHMSFARSMWLNDLVGIISFLPLLFPFEPWRIQHNHHHNHTNKLDIDNAWQPFQADWWVKLSPINKVILGAVKGPLWFIASTGHWLMKHFSLSLFTPAQRPKVMVSVGAVYAFSALFFPAMLYYVGLWGLIKYWFVPFLGFHFWLSTFTMVHHTVPFLPFMDEKEWTDARARLGSTVHCEYPYWIEFLCHQINVHVPHHVSTGIPSYNLWNAHYALKARWGKYMTECTFGFALLKDIITKCHLYDEDTAYATFKDGVSKYEAKTNKKQM
jgi:omega-6 fatty acid desaturase (delta-12 desaturase)